MSTQIININQSLNWIRPQGQNKTPYCFGDRKSIAIDQGWAKKNCIYRWTKQSTGEVAYVGEAKRQLTKRVNNYTSAKQTSKASPPNKKVYKENHLLNKSGDHLYLEYIDSFNGYNLSIDSERVFAEMIIIGDTRPYLQG